MLRCFLIARIAHTPSRFAMLTYGNRSPIGSEWSVSWTRKFVEDLRRPTARQEKLLQGLMTEIVRMTTQMHPLEMGVPLYPFSHSGVFPVDKDGPETGAPLPGTGNTYDDPQVSSPTNLRGMRGTPPIISMMAPPPVPSQASQTWPPRPTQPRHVTHLHPSQMQFQ